MWCAACVVCLLMYCLTIAPIQQSDFNPKAVETIIGEIDRMPPWPTLRRKATNADRERVEKEAAKLEDAALTIAEYSSADIREALAQYKSMIRDGKREWTKRQALFIINKYLFDIPEFVTWGSSEMGSLRLGWVLPAFLGDPKAPKPTDRVLARWPWSSDEAGRWHFNTERPNFGFHTGALYDPVRHFDLLLATFGRRSIRREQTAHEEEGRSPQAQQPIQRQDEP